MAPIWGSAPHPLPARGHGSSLQPVLGLSPHAGTGNVSLLQGTGVGLNDPYGSYPTLGILWFHDPVTARLSSGHPLRAREMLWAPREGLQCPQLPKVP